MQIVFTFDRLNLMHLVLGLFAFWMGLRDLLGKDPLIHTFFNQYDRDPEYRAMWQKKNGVLLMCNAVIFLRSSPVGSGNSASPCPQHHLDCGRSDLSCRLRKLEP